MERFLYSAHKGAIERGLFSYKIHIKDKLSYTYLNIAPKITAKTFHSTCTSTYVQTMYFTLFFIQTIPKTLNPQWREQFDFHLYDEQGGFVDITVWDKDAGKKDDFMGRYSGFHQSLWTCSHLSLLSGCISRAGVLSLTFRTYSDMVGFTEKWLHNWRLSRKRLL